MFDFDGTEGAGARHLLAASFVCLLIGLYAWGAFACKGWMVADLFWLLAALNCVSALRRAGDSAFDRVAAGVLILASGALFLVATWANRPVACAA